MSIFIKRLKEYRNIVQPLIIILILLGLLGFIILNYFLSEKKSMLPHRHDINVITPNNDTLKTFVTQNSKERHVGLSNHTHLHSDEAMLFVFDNPGIYGFHMPNMDFSIDIYWLNEEKEIVYIQESAHPDDYPKVYTPTIPALYVLEVVDGFTQKNDIEIGDSFIFQSLGAKPSPSGDPFRATMIY